MGATGLSAAAGTIVQAITRSGQNPQAGTRISSVVFCPPGYVVTGGGVNATSGDHILTGSAVSESRPEPPGNGATPTGWRGEIYFINDATNIDTNFYAICQPVS
jgi:hypothetical protein